MVRKVVVFVGVAGIAVFGISGRGVCGEGGRDLRRTPVVEVYERTRDTVVNISGVRVVSTSGWGGFAWPGFEDLWGPRYERKVSVLGSGVVVHEDGYVITNAHVVKEAQNIKAIFSNGDEYEAQVIRGDEAKDLALLKIEADKKLPFVHLGRSDDLMIGETVVAVGNPYGYSNTLTTGVLSAVGRDIQVEEGFWLRGLIQIDAPINPGNSGGPLFNINGDLIGINTAIKAGADNIGFSIPVDTLADNLRQMLMPEELRRVRLGLVVGRIKTAGAETGLVIDSVVEGSPAAEKGLEAGDIIVDMDGHKLANIIDFYIRMMSKEAGEPIAIEYVRPPNAEPKKVELAMVEAPLPDGVELARKFFQMEVSGLDEKVAERFGYESAYPILIVTGVDEGGAAEDVGLRGGDLILSIGGATVRNTKELGLALEKVKAGDVVEVAIMRIMVSRFGQVQRQYTARLKAQVNRNDHI